MSVITKPVTIADYEALGEDAPFELIRGVLYDVAVTKYVHVLVAGNFAIELGIYSRTKMPGRVLVAEAGFAFERDLDSLIVPDVAFIRADRQPPRADWNDWIRVAPDVMVEVRSPSNTDREIERKLAVYLDAGVPLIWMADTDKEQVAAYSPGGRVRVYRREDTLDGGDVLPGFSVPVAVLFR